MESVITVEFQKKGHHWLDAGLIGLIKILENMDINDVEINTTDYSLSLKGPLRNVQETLERAYDKLINEYYDVSTKKQIEDTSSYNFYYDEEKDEFISFPKRKSMGIAEMIYNKAPRPVGGQVKWLKKEKKEVQLGNKTVKLTRAILPKEYAHLQKRMDDFLNSHGLDITTSGLLLNGPNEVRPKLKIKLDNKVAGICYLCGEESNQLENANQTIFPLITGTSGVLSFNSCGGKPEKICWKCSLLGKFVPANGFYMYQGDNLFIFLPYSISLEKMGYIYDELQPLKNNVDPNLYSNFNHNLGPYIQHTYEATFAFLYRLYEHLSRHKKAEEDDGILELETIWNFTLNKAPIEFFIIHTKKEGNTFSGKLFWIFKDSVYIFRLFNYIREKTNTTMTNILSCLIDYSQKNNEAKTYIRNKILEKILKKQTILGLVEQFVYTTGIKYFTPLFEMLLAYENLLREGDEMYKEEQEAAVKLGRAIGLAVGNSPNGKKGDLYALRKSRKKTDFLEQINRLQFKLGNELVVPKDIYEGKLTDDNFIEFKQYCMIAALNSYNYTQSPKDKSKKEG